MQSLTWSRFTSAPPVFPVHKKLLCARSEYFRAAFEGRFKEAKGKEMTVDTDPETFAAFINWVYTGTFELSANRSGFGMGNSDMRNHIKAYIVADKCESSAFRRVVFDAIFPAIKAGNMTYSNNRFVFDSLPEPSGLRKFCLDYLYHRWPLSNDQHLNHALNWWPREIATSVIFHKTTHNRERCKRPLYERSNVCDYHEHKDEEEGKACEAACKKS